MYTLDTTVLVKQLLIPLHTIFWVLQIFFGFYFLIKYMV